MTGENLDLSSEAQSQPGPSGSSAPGNRSFVGVHFVCCDVYTRVYVNDDQRAYIGHCPRCGRRIRIRVGPGGTDSRFFTAG